MPSYQILNIISPHNIVLLKLGKKEAKALNSLYDQLNKEVLNYSSRQINRRQLKENLLFAVAKTKKELGFNWSLLFSPFIKGFVSFLISLGIINAIKGKKWLFTQENKTFALLDTLQQELNRLTIPLDPIPTKHIAIELPPAINVQPQDTSSPVENPKPTDIQVSPPTNQGKNAPLNNQPVKKNPSIKTYSAQPSNAFENETNNALINASSKPITLKEDSAASSQTSDIDPLTSEVDLCNSNQLIPFKELNKENVKQVEFEPTNKPEAIFKGSFTSSSGADEAVKEKMNAEIERLTSSALSLNDPESKSSNSDVLAPVREVTNQALNSDILPGMIFLAIKHQEQQANFVKIYYMLRLLSAFVLSPYARPSKTLTLTHIPELKEDKAPLAPDSLPEVKVPQKKKKPLKSLKNPDSEVMASILAKIQELEALKQSSSSSNKVATQPLLLNEEQVPYEEKKRDLTLEPQDSNLMAMIPASRPASSSYEPVPISPSTRSTSSLSNEQESYYPIARKAVIKQFDLQSVVPYLLLAMPEDKQVIAYFSFYMLFNAIASLTLLKPSYHYLALRYEQELSGRAGFLLRPVEASLRALNKASLACIPATYYVPQQPKLSLTYKPESQSLALAQELFALKIKNLSSESKYDGNLPSEQLHLSQESLSNLELAKKLLALMKQRTSSAPKIDDLSFAPPSNSSDTPRSYPALTYISEEKKKDLSHSDAYNLTAGSRDSSKMPNFIPVIPASCPASSSYNPVVSCSSSSSSSSTAYEPASFPVSESKNELVNQPNPLPAIEPSIVYDPISKRLKTLIIESKGLTPKLSNSTPSSSSNPAPLERKQQENLNYKDYLGQAIEYGRMAHTTLSAMQEIKKDIPKVFSKLSPLMPLVPYLRIRTPNLESKSVLGKVTKGLVADATFINSLLSDVFPDLLNLEHSVVFHPVRTTKTLLRQGAAIQQGLTSGAVQFLSTPMERWLEPATMLAILAKGYYHWNPREQRTTALVERIEAIVTNSNTLLGLTRPFISKENADLLHCDARALPNLHQTLNAGAALANIASTMDDNLKLTFRNKSAAGSYKLLKDLDFLDLRDFWSFSEQAHKTAFAYTMVTTAFNLGKDAVELHKNREIFTTPLNALQSILDELLKSSEPWPAGSLTSRRQTCTYLRQNLLGTGPKPSLFEEYLQNLIYNVMVKKGGALGGTLLSKIGSCAYTSYSSLTQGDAYSIYPNFLEYIKGPESSPEMRVLDHFTNKLIWEEFVIPYLITSPLKMLSTAFLRLKMGEQINNPQFILKMRATFDRALQNFLLNPDELADCDWEPSLEPDSDLTIAQVVSQANKWSNDAVKNLLNKALAQSAPAVPPAESKGMMSTALGYIAPPSSKMRKAFKSTVNYIAPHVSETLFPEVKVAPPSAPKKPVLPGSQSYLSAVLDIGGRAIDAAIELAPLAGDLISEHFTPTPPQDCFNNLITQSSNLAEGYLSEKFITTKLTQPSWAESIPLHLLKGIQYLFETPYPTMLNQICEAKTLLELPTEEEVGTLSDKLSTSFKLFSDTRLLVTTLNEAFTRKKAKLSSILLEAQGFGKELHTKSTQLIKDIYEEQGPRVSALLLSRVAEFQQDFKKLQTDYQAYPDALHYINLFQYIPEQLNKVVEHKNQVNENLFYFDLFKNLSSKGQFNITDYAKEAPLSDSIYSESLLQELQYLERVDQSSSAEQKPTIKFQQVMTELKGIFDRIKKLNTTDYSTLSLDSLGSVYGLYKETLAKYQGIKKSHNFSSPKGFMHSVEFSLELYLLDIDKEQQNIQEKLNKITVQMQGLDPLFNLLNDNSKVVLPPLDQIKSFYDLSKPKSDDLPLLNEHRSNLLKREDKFFDLILNKVNQVMKKEIEEIQVFIASPQASSKTINGKIIDFDKIHAYLDGLKPIMLEQLSRPLVKKKIQGVRGLFNEMKKNFNQAKIEKLKIEIKQRVNDLNAQRSKEVWYNPWSLNATQYKDGIAAIKTEMQNFAPGNAEELITFIDNLVNQFYEERSEALKKHLPAMIDELNRRRVAFDTSSLPLLMTGYLSSDMYKDCINNIKLNIKEFNPKQVQDLNTQIDNLVALFYECRYQALKKELPETIQKLNIQRNNFDTTSFMSPSRIYTTLLSPEQYQESIEKIKVSIRSEFNEEQVGDLIKLIDSLLFVKAPSVSDSSRVSMHLS